jgi:small subunit ribosomal protein S3
MGQKVNPIGIRLGITRDWVSKWYAGKKQFPAHVQTDFRVRAFLRKRLAEASVSRIHLERAAKKVNITIQTARPGIVIGKKGEDIEKLRQEVAKLLEMSATDVRLNISEIRKPELDAQLVADSIAQQIEKRVMFRRAMKRAVMSTMRSGALGVKVRVSGRLNGSEIARTEWYREGRIPLSPSAPTLTTACPRRTRPTGSSASRFGSSRARYSRSRRSKWSSRARPRQPLQRFRQCRSRRTRQLPRNSRAHESIIVLQPKRTKYRKQFKGRNAGLAMRGSSVAFGEFGLKATSRARMTAREIEAARRAMAHYVKRGGQIWIRVFPDVPISKKPLEVRMGSGKGNIEYWIARVQPGKVLFEMEGVDEVTAREAFRLAGSKLSVSTMFVKRQVR